MIFRASILRLACLFAAVSPPVLMAVDFPGTEPGTALATMSAGMYSLSNSVVAASWDGNGECLSPAAIVNKLTGESFNQSGRELFRLNTKPEAPLPDGYAVMLRLDGQQITASVSRDGTAWTKLASFPRVDFPGEPKLVRIGKMSGKATAQDYAGEAGEMGGGVISQIAPLPATLPSGTFEFKAYANHAAVTDLPFSPGTLAVSCRINKGTDAGMTWGPALALIWDDGKRFLSVGVRDSAGVFNVISPAGEQIIAAHPEPYPVFDTPAAGFHFDRTEIVTLRPDLKSACLADHVGGKAIESSAVSDHGIRVHWRAELRDGSNYIRQTVQLSSMKDAIPLTAVELADVAVPDCEAIGTTPGCPIAGDGLFAGVEMPGATNALDPAGARVGFRCKLQLTPSQPYSFGEVVGVYPDGQLRRSFLYYVERERARPSKPFLHYNGWYDLGYNDLNEQNVLNVIDAYNRELVQKRGVPIQSFLIDDGWDDVHAGLWAENKTRFPNGLPGVAAKAKSLDAHLGVWISPLGGYGGREERTADARKMGLIPPTGELDLSYPKYNAWFLDRCETLMRDAGVNAFKWDKAGEGVSPHLMALLGIAQKLHAINPELFINVTVGTWPSPFWLNFVDTTWRDGSGDVGWAGEGADPNNPHDRERWLTYRDGNCYRLFVQRSPLYPLNSVMHHGLVLGKYFQGADMASNGANLRHEARSYFANGASLQELYLTPSLMTPAAWDDVADAVKWAHANASVLVDSHWVGGDPLKLEPYGFAAWSPSKATLMLRNPSDAPRSISIDAAKVFELPAGTATHFTVKSGYSDTAAPVESLVAGQPVSITLQPFDVLVLQMTPKRS